MCHFGPWIVVGRIKQKHNLLHQTLNDETGFSQRVIQPMVEIRPIPVRTTLKPPVLLVRILTIYMLVFVLKHLTQSLWKQFLSSQFSGLAWPHGKGIHHLPTYYYVAGTSLCSFTFICQLTSSRARTSKPQPSHPTFPLSQPWGFPGGHLISCSDSPSELWQRFPKSSSSLREIPNRPIIVGPCDWPHISINTQVLFWSGNPKGQSPQWAFCFPSVWTHFYLLQPKCHPLSLKGGWFPNWLSVKNFPSVPQAAALR